jgi:poly(3-hydroxybutyrate) depolymerase
MSLRSLAWVFLALLLLSAPARADEKITKESLESRGGKRTYYLFVPASAKAPAPLVVLLHGSGHNGLSLMEKWKDLAEREGLLLAGPDSSDPRGWRIPRRGAQAEAPGQPAPRLPLRTLGGRRLRPQPLDDGVGVLRGGGRPRRLLAQGV